MVDCLFGMYICFFVCDFGVVFGVGGYFMVLCCIRVGLFEVVDVVGIDDLEGVEIFILVEVVVCIFLVFLMFVEEVCDLCYGK